MPSNPEKLHAIVGVWEMNAIDAPFQWHMVTFTPYGTMSQSNPHEGNRDDSDSNGHGVWQPVGSAANNSKIRGKFVEFKADRTTGEYTGKGVIEFSITVKGDTFTGTYQAYRYDTEGIIVKRSPKSPLSGTRVRLDEL